MHSYTLRTRHIGSLAAVFAVVGLLLTLGSVQAWAGAGGFQYVQSAELLERDFSEVRVGARFESDRQLTNDSDSKYDNIRFHPIAFNTGLGDGLLNVPLEVGASLGYTMNDSSNSPRDESGLEGASLYGQLGLDRLLQTNVLISPQFGATFAGEDEVVPFGNDGLDLWFNVPVRHSLGNGMDLFWEVGYTNKADDFESYVNYGIGLGAGLTPSTRGSLELVGHDATVDVPTAEDHLELIGRLDWQLAPAQRFAPSVGVGLDDGSPDFSVGLVYIQTIHTP